MRFRPGINHAPFGWVYYIPQCPNDVRLGLKANAQSYEKLCSALGRYGFYGISVFMSTFAIGAMCAYLVIIGDTIPDCFEFFTGKHVDRWIAVIVFSAFFILPLCLMRDMASLAKIFVSVLADLTVVILILALAGKEAEETYPNIDKTPTIAKPKTLFGGIGAMSFAFVCHHSSFIVFNTLKVQTTENWRKVAAWSISISVLASSALAVGGYLAFFEETKSDILNNFNTTSVNGFDVSFLPIQMARFLLALR